MQHHLAGRLVDLGDLGHVLGDEILVLHGEHGQLQSDETPHLARPEAAGVDHMLGLDVALVGDHVPGAVAAGPRIRDPGLRVDLRAALLGAARKGVRRARRIEMALDGVIERARELALVDQGQPPLGLIQRDQLALHAEIAALGLDVFQPLVALLGGRKHQAFGHVQAARLAGDFLDLLVEVDAVLLQLGDVGIAVDGVHAARCMPGGARGELQALDQHHILPALLGQVIEHARPDDAAADDDCLRMGFHGHFLAWSKWFVLVSRGHNWFIASGRGWRMEGQGAAGRQRKAPGGCDSLRCIASQRAPTPGR